MVQRKPTAAVAVIVVLLLSAVVAAIALATTSQDAVAQQGCTGGGSSPSPSVSPSPSESEEGPIPSILPSLIPDPAPKKAAKKAADPAPLPAPDKDRAEADAADQQQRSCRSTITLAYKSGRNPQFTGAVDSDEPMCKRARNVTIKKVKRGADPTVAKATTNTKGKYTAPARKANGRFYAKVSAATTENRDGESVKCSAARSRAIKP